MKIVLSYLIIIFYLAWAISYIGFPAAHGATDKSQGVWPMQPGWEVTYEMDDKSRTMGYRLLAITETKEGQVYEFLATYRLISIYSVVQTYLKTPDGDIYYVSGRHLPTGETSWYDPPILYLDLPLSPGKTWESKSTYHHPDDLDGLGEPEHHVFRVEATKIETPVGTFETLELIDEPLAGSSIGGDFYLPGFGPVAFESKSLDELVLMTGNSLHGWAPDKGHGEQVAYNFGWKPGMAWRVEKDSFIEQISAGVEGFESTKLEFTLKVDWMPKGLIITKKDFFLPGISDRDTLDAVEAAMIDLSAQIKTRIMVGVDGKFQALMAREAADQSAKELIDSLLGTDSKKSEWFIQTLQKARQLVDPDFLEQVALGEWATMVGTWLGSTAEIGTVVTISYPLVMPLYPDRTVTMNAIFVTAERCPCEEGSSEFDCVEAHFSGYSLPEEGSTLNVRSSIKWIIEPEGMFFHRMETYTRYEVSEDPKYEDVVNTIWEEYSFKPTGTESQY